MQAACACIPSCLLSSLLLQQLNLIIVDSTYSEVIGTTPAQRASTSGAQTVDFEG
jgi:hypothetical protein